MSLKDVLPLYQGIADLIYWQDRPVSWREACLALVILAVLPTFFLLVTLLSFTALSSCGGGGSSDSTVVDIIYEGKFIDNLVEGLN